MDLFDSLKALQSYNSDDSDVDEEKVAHQTIPQPDVSPDVVSLLQELVDRVCGSATAREPVRCPDFRTTRNDFEISIDSSSSSSSWSLSSDEGNDASEEQENTTFRPPRTKGEIGLEELPPIQRLDIRAKSEELSHMGRVSHILGNLVTVVSFAHLPPLDLDSILFSKDGLSLGQIFDVFGPVKEPRYLLRFNNESEIRDSSIVVDMPVYYAPNLPYTSYVFTANLMTIRGSDASWEHDNEPPDDVRDYSDDEEERRDKSRIKRKNR